MKRRVLGLGMAVSLILISGCTNTTSNQTDLSSKSTSVTEVDFTNEMKEIEDGLSYIEYTENYGFEDFIKQGGASADSDVFQFLAGNLLSEAEGLSLVDTAFGCSTVSVQNTDNQWVFGRNFDWNKCNALVIKSKPQEGYASIATVNMDFIKQGAGFASSFLSDEQMALAALYAPLDGMNEEGLCISVNMISDGESIEQNTEKPDLTTTTAVRFLLNNASSVDEAVELLNEYDMHSSMGMMVHFAIADKTGKSVVVEYIDNEMHVTETSVVTNFYLTEGDKYGIGTEESHERYDILMNTIEDRKLSMTEVVDALDRVSKDNFEDSSTTEWSAVFNHSTGKVIYYHRENFDKGYEFSINE